MTQTGSFVSEVYVHDQNYHFRAQFTSVLWNAQVVTENGAHFLSLSCVAPKLQLHPDDIEDALAEWVHRAVVCCADAIRLQTARRLALACSNAPRLSVVAANGDDFAMGENFDSIILESGSRKNMVFSNPARLRQLHERSAAAIHRFQVVSQAYEKLRQQIPLDKELDIGR